MRAKQRAALDKRFGKEDRKPRHSSAASVPKKMSALEEAS